MNFLSSEAVMQLASAELLEAHSSLDRVGIPREDEDGEKMTISQRVKMAVDLISALVEAQSILRRVRA